MARAAVYQPLLWLRLRLTSHELLPLDSSDSDLRSRPFRLSRVRLYRVLTVRQMLLGVFAPLGVELVILLTHDHRQNYKQNHENADDLTDLARTTRSLS